LEKSTHHQSYKPKHTAPQPVGF